MVFSVLMCTHDVHDVHARSGGQRDSWQCCRRRLAHPQRCHAAQVSSYDRVGVLHGASCRPARTLRCFGVHSSLAAEAAKSAKSAAAIASMLWSFCWGRSGGSAPFPGDVRSTALSVTFAQRRTLAQQCCSSRVGVQRRAPAS